MPRIHVTRLALVSSILAAIAAATYAQQASPANPLGLDVNRTEAVRITDHISEAIGFGNTFLVTTPEGNVVIDTSSAAVAPQHVKLLKAVSSAPVKYIILTHGHGDHTGGVPLWKEPGTQVIAQKNQTEFLAYQARLGGFFAVRNAAQFGRGLTGGQPDRPGARGAAANVGARAAADILFDDTYEFTLGGVKFMLYATPGETPDHLTVWIPQWKAAFSGDNYYLSFPNMYTLRGTEPRWALDYVKSLNKVMSLQPEILLPSHGPAVQGSDEIARRLTRYRDAIVYVHDAVVKGMNSGKDVYTLMREIHLPKELEVGEGYGKLTWSIRGIYEGYAGWFDMNPANMYETPAEAIYGDLVKLAGGPDVVVKLAQLRLSEGKFTEALRLTDAALAADPSNRAALEAKLKALDTLVRESKNSNELGWLNYSIAETKKKM
jgi:alkyl sulfatase BDS1-like metallo-beta-lactamase superfamily hydrolase